MRAEEIMTRQPCVVVPGETVEYAAELMKMIDVGLLPVVNDRETMRLEGVISDRDIVIRHVAARHARGCSVGDHMNSSSFATVNPDTNVHDVIARMAQEHVRRILVVGDDQRIVGIIAQADVEFRVGPRQTDTVERVLALPGPY